MKILSSQELRKADQFTIESEPIASIDLMERAAAACFNWLSTKLDLSKRKLHIYCGTGNNGGDGLALARMLFRFGATVHVYCIGDPELGSSDFKTNLQRWKDLSNQFIQLTKATDLPIHQPNELIIDALFGTGLTRPTAGLPLQTIEHINSSKNDVISIDLPSGMFSEDNSMNNSSGIINAKHTLTFQSPKLAFLLADCGEKCGDWHVLDIGLDREFIQQCMSPFYLLEKTEIEPLLKERKRFSHKGTYGHSLLIAGSKGKMGAAVLSTAAALKAGSGLVSAFIPECGYTILQSSVPEAMCFTSQSEDHISGYQDWDQFTSIAIGPGIGTHSDTKKTVIHLLKNSKKPLTLDADALNIIAAQPDLMNFIPKNSILTPHPKEFDRLFGVSNSAYDRLLKQREMAIKYHVILVLKGSFTSVANTNGEIFFNPTGNPSMATGGSGDVLTGIIAGLLAQSNSPENAAKLGVYFHGQAGDSALKSILQQSITARDIVKSYTLKTP
jgi:ADP-dependent NAD(P)H-hydrate dehydratase / NAD(P)H-hydrate epimerase